MVCATVLALLIIALFYIVKEIQATFLCPTNNARGERKGMQMRNISQHRRQKGHFGDTLCYCLCLDWAEDSQMESGPS